MSDGRERAMFEQDCTEAMIRMRDARAVRFLPTQWARVAGKVGASKARQNLRRLAEHMEKEAQLRADGASCASCRSFKRESPSSMPSLGSWCAAQSDFHGYVPMPSTELCTRWHAA